MKELVFITALVAFSFFRLNAQPIHPNEVLNILSKTIPENWECLRDSNKIDIIKKDSLWLAFYVGAGLCDSEEQFLKENGRKAIFVITLNFTDLLTQEQLDEIEEKREKRRTECKKLPYYDAKSKFSYEKEIIRTYPLPKYRNKNYSIFVTDMKRDFENIHSPENAKQEV